VVGVKWKAGIERRGGESESGGEERTRKVFEDRMRGRINIGNSILLLERLTFQKLKKKPGR